VAMRVVYWGRWADASGGVGPLSQTCAAPVENAPQCLPGGASLLALPGAQCKNVRVMPMSAMCSGYITAEGAAVEDVRLLDAA